MPANDLVATVRKLRHAIDDTQQEFAHRLGLSIATAVRYEHNRPPRGKALAKLAEVAAAHGLDEYAAVFRRALSNELGAPPPAPTGLTVEAKNEEERDLLVALLDVLRKPAYAEQAETLKRTLKPVAVQRQDDAEYAEALEQSALATVRLLKSGKDPEEIKTRTGMSAERIAKAFFHRGGPEFFGGVPEWDNQFKGIVRLLLKEGWGIQMMANEFGGQADDFHRCARDLEAWDAISSYEEEEREKQQDAEKQ